MNCTQKEFHEQIKGTPLECSLNKIKTESVRWDHENRIKQYHQLEEQKLQEQIEALFKKLNHLGIEDMEQFIQELNQLRENLMQRWRNTEITSSYVLTSMKDYIYCYRQATEIYYINTRHKLEPDTEQQEETTIPEEQISQELLNDDTLKDRLTLLKNIIGE